MSEPKVLIWDIEATNLSAPFGKILCIGYKWVGKPRVYCPTILDYEQPHGRKLSDEQLVDDFVEVYKEADYTVAHYGQRYDLPMINSKLVKYNKKPLPPTPLIDTWKFARYQMKMHSNRLAAISEYLGTESQKTEISYDDWLDAAAGDPKSIREVVDHCKKDVLTLEEVFLKIKAFIPDLPATNLLASGRPDVCTNCGQDSLQQNGWRTTRTRRYPRFVCTNCGKWHKGTKSVAILQRS